MNDDTATEAQRALWQHFKVIINSCPSEVKEKLSRGGNI